MNLSNQNQGHQPEEICKIDYIKSSESKVSVSVPRSRRDIFNIQFTKLEAKTRSGLLILHAKIFGSLVFVVTLSEPLLGIGFSIPSSISTLKLIAEDEDIMKACQSGDALWVKKVLQSGRPGPRVITPSGATPLSVCLVSV